MTRFPPTLQSVLPRDQRSGGYEHFRYRGNVLPYRGRWAVVYLPKTGDRCAVQFDFRGNREPHRAPPGCFGWHLFPLSQFTP